MVEEARIACVCHFHEKMPGATRRVNRSLLLDFENVARMEQERHMQILAQLRKELRELIAKRINEMAARGDIGC